MNRVYELMFIVRPDMAEEDLDKLISTLQSAVPASAGTIKSVDKMGKRRLAYTVRRHRAGDQVSHRACRRRAEAAGEDQGAARCAQESQCTACARSGSARCTCSGRRSARGNCLSSLHSHKRHSEPARSGCEETAVSSPRQVSAKFWFRDEEKVNG